EASSRGSPPLASNAERMISAASLPVETSSRAASGRANAGSPKASRRTGVSVAGPRSRARRHSAATTAADGARLTAYRSTTWRPSASRSASQGRRCSGPSGTMTSRVTSGPRSESPRPEVGDRRLQHRLAELAPELAGVGPTFQQGDEARDPGEQWFGGGKLVGLDALALHDEERGRGLPASDDELEQRGALVGERGG